MQTNIELKGIGLKKFLKEVVVVKYLDDDRKELVAITGVLTDFNEDGFDEDGNPTQSFIAIWSLLIA